MSEETKADKASDVIDALQGFAASVGLTSSDDEIITEKADKDEEEPTILGLPAWKVALGAVASALGLAIVMKK